MNAANTDSSYETVTVTAVPEAFSDTTVTLVDEAALMHVGGGSLVNFY